MDTFVKYAELDAQVTMEVYEHWRKTMGQSPTASIIFGYAFTQENVWPWQSEEDFLEEGEEADIKRDWGAREWYLHIAKDKTVNEVEAMGWEEREAIWKEIPIEVDVWGYMEDACYMIYPTGGALMTSWDDAQPIEVSWFHDTARLAKWVEQLNRFIAEMRIDVGEEAARFLLVASYG